CMKPTTRSGEAFGVRELGTALVVVFAATGIPSHLGIDNLRPAAGDFVPFAANGNRLRKALVSPRRRVTQMTTKAVPSSRTPKASPIPMCGLSMIYKNPFDSVAENECSVKELFFGSICRV